MKSELIDKLFDKFIEDKEIIKQNLILATDKLSLLVKDEYNKITLEIRVEKNDKT